MSLSLFLALSGPAGADEVLTNLPVECEADVVTFRHEEQMVVGEGHVRVTYDRFLLTCDYAEVHVDTKDVLAKGHVILQEGGNTYRAEEMTYNFDTRLGKIQNGEVVSPPKIYGKAVRGEKTGDETVELEDGHVTTCEFAVPHYRVDASSIDIYWNDKIIGRNAWLRAGEAPLLWLPYYVHFFNRPSVIVTPGKSKDFGAFLLTAWGYSFNENLEGRVHLDWREDLGFGSGVDLDYRTPNLGAGRVETYYTQERSRAPDEGIKAEDERWRVRVRHQWELDDETQIHAEYFEQSDRDFTQDYFEDEFQEEENPESFVSLTKIEERYRFFAKFKKRANRHESVTETLPEIKLDIHKEPILGDALFFESETSLINFNSKTATEVEATTPRPSLSTTSDADAVRVHNLQKLTATHRFFGWLDVTPQVNFQTTWWSKEASGLENVHRTAFGTGVGASTRFYRIFEVQSNALGLNINRLRHLVVPSIDYTYNRRPSVAAARLLQFDTVDALAGSNSITFALDNILQTKRKASAQAAPVNPETPSLDEAEVTTYENVNLADFALSADYTFKPEGGGSALSGITGNLQLRPYPWLVSEMEAVYDHVQDRFDTYQLDVIAEGKRFSAGVGYGYEADRNAELTTDVTYRISPLWAVRVFERFDLRENGIIEQEYSLEREMHDVVVSMNYNVEDAESIWLVIRPKAFPATDLLRFSTSYHRPKIGRNF